MIEKALGLEKMTILQCQELAKKIGFDSATFNLCGPKASIPCRWLDAYLGFFTVRDDEGGGFMMASDFQFNNDVWCTDLNPSGDE